MTATLEKRGKLWQHPGSNNDQNVGHAEAETFSGENVYGELSPAGFTDAPQLALTHWCGERESEFDQSLSVG